MISGVSGVIWSAILTGSADSTTDLDLILVSFQATLRDSGTTFMSFAVSFDQLDDINARPNGDIVLYKTKLPDGSATEVYRVNFNDIRSDEGARSATITISGRSDTAWPAGSSVMLVDVESDDLLASGARQLKVNPANDVIPGDTVTYDSTPTTIEIVALSGNKNGTTMTLTEA